MKRKKWAPSPKRVNIPYIRYLFQYSVYGGLVGMQYLLSFLFDIDIDTIRSKIIYVPWLRSEFIFQYNIDSQSVVLICKIQFCDQMWGAVVVDTDVDSYWRDVVITCIPRSVCDVLCVVSVRYVCFCGCVCRMKCMPMSCRNMSCCLVSSIVF